MGARVSPRQKSAGSRWANQNKEGSKKGIVEGWVFGAKINIVNIANPAKKGMEDDYSSSLELYWQ